MDTQIEMKNNILQSQQNEKTKQKNLNEEIEKNHITEKPDGETNTEANLLKGVITKRKGEASPSDMELVWKNLQIVAKAPNKGCFNKTPAAEDKIILNNVSGRTRSGECLAIIGSSGAGKTTLLNYLSRKIESGNLKVTGEVLLNGEVINNDRFDLIASYVMQDDVLEPTMTPLEILLFTAKLKLDLPPIEIEKKVERMIQDLHLTKCQNTRIGSNLQRGISGGERKRTSIGVELISDPKIIFLDEPTTGLDSYNAYEVLQLLQTLSSEGKIIIFTIHQPSSEIFDLLDKLCILALGKTVFFGPSEQAFECFESSGLKMQDKYNPFEYFMEITNVSAPQRPDVIKNFPELESIENLNVRYETFVTSLNKKYEGEKENKKDDHVYINGFSAENEQLFLEKNIKRSYAYEFGILFLRNILITMRNPFVLFIRLFQALITGCILTALFVRVTKDFSGVQDRTGIILNLIVFCILGASSSVLLMFSEERKVFTRERANKLYTVSAYFFSKTLAELPVFFVMNSLFGLITYYPIELNDTYSYKYYIFLGLLNLSTMAGVSYAYFTGTLANNQEALVTLNTVMTIPLLLLSGFFANADNFAPYLIPFKYISSFKYAFQVLMHNEFNDLSPLNCFNLDPDVCNPVPTRFSFLEPYYVNFIALACLVVLFKGLALMMLYFFAKIKV